MDVPCRPKFENVCSSGGFVVFLGDLFEIGDLRTLELEYLMVEVVLCTRASLFLSAGRDFQLSSDVSKFVLVRRLLRFQQEEQKRSERKGSEEEIKARPAGETGSHDATIAAARSTRWMAECADLEYHNRAPPAIEVLADECLDKDLPTIVVKGLDRRAQYRLHIKLTAGGTRLLAVHVTDTFPGENPTSWAGWEAFNISSHSTESFEKTTGVGGKIAAWREGMRVKAREQQIAAAARRADFVVRCPPHDIFDMLRERCPDHVLRLSVTYDDVKEGKGHDGVSGVAAQDGMTTGENTSQAHYTDNTMSAAPKIFTDEACFTHPDSVSSFSAGYLDDFAYFLRSSYQLFGCHIPSVAMDSKGYIVLPASVKRLKIDVGLSFNAPNSELWLERIPELAVFGFEPNLRAVSDILSGSRARGSTYVYLDKKRVGKTWFLFPVALGATQGHVKFYNTINDPGQSSVFEPEAFGSYSEEVVPMFTLSDLLSRIPWGYEGDDGVFPIIEHIKTDAQGFDVEVLRGAGRFLSERVVCVTSEKAAWGYKDTGHSAQELIDFMWREGFVLMSDLGGDFTFVNTNLTDWLPDVDCTTQGL